MNTLPLTVLAQTSIKITVGWTPIPGVLGYRFFRDGQPVSSSWDPAKTQVTFAIPDSSPHTFTVLAVQGQAQGQVVVNGPPPPPPPPASGSSWYAGPFNTKIPANPKVELGYGQGGIGRYGSMGMGGPAFAHAFFDSRGKGWPTRTVVNPDGWTMDGVPLPPNVQQWWAIEPSSGYYERHMSVIGDNHVWTIYGSSSVDGTYWHCRSLGCMRAPGETMGVWDNPLGPFIGPVSGIVAGPVMKAEMDAGLIPHALVLLGGEGNNSSDPREPATYGDGKAGSYNPATNLQVGSLLQLDPTLDVNIAGVKWAPIVKAWQEYGGYIRDSSTTGILRVVPEAFNNSGVVHVDDGTFGSAMTKLIPHLRLIGLESVPATKAHGLVYDDRTVSGQPHK